MMSRMMRGLLTLILLSQSASADELQALEEQYGRGDLSAVTGNGGLTVGINATGTISLCRWPSPSYSDHLSYRSRIDADGTPRAEEGGGLRWGVQLGEKWIWMEDPLWSTQHEYTGDWPPVIRSTSALRDSPIRVVRTLVVHPDRDVFASRITISGYENEPPLQWSAHFAPCTSNYPEMPLADWYDDTRNGFAAFAQGGGDEVTHFRPRAPGISEWARAEALVAGQEPFDTWLDFGAGVWIVQGTAAEVTGFHLGSGVADLSEDLRRQELGQHSAVGTPYSTQRMLPEARGDGGVGASVFVAIGASLADARESLRWAAALGYDRFMDEVGESVGNPSDASADSPNDTTDFARLMDRLRTLLLVMQDRQTGAIVRSPAAQPPLARDWPRHALWMTYALDLAGFHDRAERHCLFLAQRIRRLHRRGMPVGSMPATLYADGVPASPHVLLDLEAPPGMIMAMLMHARILSAEERDTFLAAIWPTVRLSGDFLASWMDARDGSPLHSFDLAQRHDSQSFDRLVATRAGIGQALEIADLAGEDAPESWARRKAQLDVLLVNNLANLDDPWPVDARLPFTITDSEYVLDSIFEGAVSARLEALPELHGIQAAQVLAELAMLYRGDAANLTQLEPYAVGVLNSVLAGGPDSSGTAFPDGLAIAMAYVAATLISNAGDMQ